MRVYKERESIYTKIFNDRKNDIFYNLLLSTVIFLLICNLTEGILLEGRLNVGLDSFFFGFGKLHYTILIWLFLFMKSIIIYPMFNFWTRMHCKTLELSESYNRIFNFFSLYLLILYYLAILAIPTSALLYVDLPPLSSFVILMEELRIIMKIHSYVRNNAPAVLKYKPKEDFPNSPDFDKFLYFQFAPTLIYQDEYPRSKTTNWKFVLNRTCEVLILGYLVSMIFDGILKEFRDTCINKKSIYQILLVSFRNILMSLLGLASLGGLLIHSWSNAFAEVLRFGDRLFHKDWWNTPSILKYYRMWNDIVQDWLFFYIYKDVLHYVFPGKKKLSKIMVFFVSALFHEYVIGVSLRLLFPLDFSIFFFGSVLMMHVNRDFGNVYFLLIMGWGVSVHICFYSLEYNAIFNCPLGESSFYEKLVPRFISCNCTYL